LGPISKNGALMVVIELHTPLLYSSCIIIAIVFPFVNNIFVTIYIFRAFVKKATEICVFCELKRKKKNIIL